MDSKISQFPVATTLTGNDLIPIVTDSVSKSIAASVFTLNMPNLGNKGITKNAVIQASTLTIPLTNTVVTLPVNGSAYTLSSGSDGQEITLISLGANSVNMSGYLTHIGMVVGSSITLVFVTSLSKWIPKSYHICTLT